MTREDILVVEQNVHLKHFIYELVRCIDESVPVANFFSCSDDESLLNAQKYISNALADRLFFGGKGECKFSIGDKIVFKDNPMTAYVVADFVNVAFSENRLALGVALMRMGEEGEQSDAFVYPPHYVNQNFIAESEA